MGGAGNDRRRRRRWRGRRGRTTASLLTLAACVACGEEPTDEDPLPPLPVEVVEGDQPLVEDYEILGAVRGELWSDEETGRRPIGIDVHRGVVTLTGAVNDEAAKRRAVRRAEAVPGVRAVVDHLLVSHRPFVERRRAPAPPPSDAASEEAIRDAWRQDERLSTAILHVRVHDGVALLTGRVANAATRRAAADDARHAVGVREVRDLVEVVPDEEAR
ncbi:MAG TPA: BON domain-containing protein [Sandaracinaceae bacterium LLY-WYZ-13_1]|nr:BON domain-containing protein [Sandaracinaceae bacterium LLY-WYZ-13_1]